MGLSVLLVDDDASVRSFLTDLLASWGYAVDSVETGEEAVKRLAGGIHPSVMLLDVLMPGMGGLEVLERAKHLNSSVPVIVVSSTGQTKTVVEAMKAGASDYLVKPFDEEELELAIENAIEKQKLRDEVQRLKRQLESTDRSDLVTINPKMQRIRDVARHVAATDVPVLILGESGVGKEVVAKYIHEHSERRDKPLIKVNCAALPNDLLESELFGHERGAFTGAISEKPGKFELADKGFLLMDEIAEMSPQLQAKLLHVLQDGEYSRLGAKRPTRSDARILALTNRHLEEAVAKGEFREDLYFRLNVIKIEVPPLRERPEDVPLLCNLFFGKYRDKYNRDIEQLPKELIEAFMKHDWPGNVRQLENAIKKFLILPEIDMVVSDLKAGSVEGRTAIQGNVSLKQISSAAAGQAEREAVLRTLEQTGWNRKKAAQELRISYKALLNKLKKWQFDTRPRGLPGAAGVSSQDGRKTF